MPYRPTVLYSLCVFFAMWHDDYKRTQYKLRQFMTRYLFNVHIDVLKCICNLHYFVLCKNIFPHNEDLAVSF